MWVVNLLARSPKNGAEIMNSIEEMSQGWWRPSPGSIYPLLEGLVQDGVIQRRDDGRYELTPKGREEMEWPMGPWGMRPSQPLGVEGVLKEMSGHVSYLEDMSRPDRSGLGPHIGTIKSLVDRLSALIKG